MSQNEAKSQTLTNTSTIDSRDTLVAPRKLSPRVVVPKILKWTVLAFFLFITLFPIIWLFLQTMKTNAEFMMNPLALPTGFHWQNYVDAVQISGLPRMFMNSMLVSGGSTAINMLICSMGAFVFAREKFKGQNIIVTIILSGVLVPIIAFMVPYYMIIRDLGLFDSLLGLAIVYTAINIPISTFLLQGFMKSIPFELEEAGVIDGCSFWQRYWRIVLPLSKIGIVTAGTFVFLFSWNEFIYALLLTASFTTRTLQLGIRDFTGQFYTNYTGMYAAIILTIIPSIAVYVFFHEKIISGLTAGALKT